MSEIAVRNSAELSIPDQMHYAEVITQGDLVPKAYQGKPANALLAIGLGAAMGLSPAESLMRIDVIQGKPTASAELIASNVRKAGHKLRVHSDPQNMSVTAQVIRADDPEHTYTVTRDMAWAKRMGLDGKDNYKKQPLTMLEWRAISAIARLACSEALYGVQYTADELADMGERPAPPAAPTVSTEPEADAITEAQWRDLLAAGAERGLSPAEVGNLAAHTVGRPLPGWQAITTDDLDGITAAINAYNEEN